MAKAQRIQRVQRIQFTKEGLENLKQEQIKLLAKRPAAVTSLQKAREMGDLSENGAYKAARFELNQIDGRLRHIDRVLRSAIVMEAKDGIVSIDAKVTITDGTHEQTFHIVGGYESDPIHGKISTYSPIGKALAGRKVGETVAVITPAGNKSFTILSINS